MNSNYIHNYYYIINAFVAKIVENACKSTKFNYRTNFIFVFTIRLRSSKMRRVRSFVLLFFFAIRFGEIYADDINAHRHGEFAYLNFYSRYQSRKNTSSAHPTIPWISALWDGRATDKNYRLQHWKTNYVFINYYLPCTIVPVHHFHFVRFFSHFYLEQRTAMQSLWASHNDDSMQIQFNFEMSQLFAAAIFVNHASDFRCGAFTFLVWIEAYFWIKLHDRT